MDDIELDDFGKKEDRPPEDRNDYDWDDYEQENDF